ncbi:HAD-IA family hydrolase, partial [Klebsiella pneumoniae]|nr:HAD-IA family hydrolase [Klebsiella pneumoniae]
NTLLQGTIISGVEHLHKPQPEIFELAMSRFGLKPQTTVFFDDKPVNIDGAHNVGMHGFVFTTTEQARKDWASLGVRL